MRFNGINSAMALLIESFPLATATTAIRFQTENSAIKGIVISQFFADGNYVIIFSFTLWRHQDQSFPL